jgi:NADH-quinone oxidoreductase subunit H
VARRLSLLLFLLVAVFGCDSRQRMPELLALTGITRESVSDNDVLDLLSRGPMPGVARNAQVVFEGDLFRPGRAPTPKQTIVIDGASVLPDRVSLTFRQDAIERFTGRGDDAIHTTFRGTVRVEIPTETVSLAGSIPGHVVLDVTPRFVRRAIEEERSKLALESSRSFGVEVDETNGTPVVRSVVDGGPFSQAGVLVGDRIASVDGVRVASIQDLAPSLTTNRVRLEVIREDESIALDVMTQGVMVDASRAATIPILLLSVVALLLVIFASPLGAIIGVLRHRAESASRRPAGGSFFRAATSSRAPLVAVFVGASIFFAAMPIAELRYGIEIDVGIVFLLSFTSLTTMTLLTAGGSTRGGIRSHLRALLAVVLCEVPAAIALLHIVLFVGSLHLGEIVSSQAGPEGALADTGGMPWFFHAFRRPQLFALFVLFFAALLIEPKNQLIQPTERTFRFHAHEFARWGNVFVMCGVATAVFLGGWLVPGVPLHDHATKTGYLFLGTAMFLLKSWLLTLFVVGMRAVLPRLSPSHLPRIVLRVFAPILALSLALTFIETRFVLLPRFRVLTSTITFSVIVAIFAIIVFDVVRRGSANRTYRLNTFL